MRIHAHLLLTTALSTTLVAAVPSAASAQDPAYDWSGFYVGSTIGVVQSDGPVDFNYPAGGGPPAGSGYGFDGNTLTLDGASRDTGLPTIFHLDARNAAVGIDMGYNVQFGQLVLGIEGDISAVNERSAGSGATPSGKTIVTATTSLDSLSSLRARAGISVDRLMFFATGGLAAGQTSLDTGLDYGPDGGKSASAHGSSAGLVTGVIGGAGIEYAATDKLSIKLEGLYFNLNSQTATAHGSGINGGPQTLQPYSATYSPSGFEVRAGLNVHF